jgi:phosphoribosylformylglycinamidine synthase subunit PurS
MKAKIEVMLREDIFDPQGKTIMNALHHMGHKDISKVKAGKLFFVDIQESDRQKAMKKLEEMSHELFANPVIENYKIEIIEN